MTPDYHHTDKTQQTKEGKQAHLEMVSHVWCDRTIESIKVRLGGACTREPSKPSLPLSPLAKSQRARPRHSFIDRDRSIPKREQLRGKVMKELQKETQSLSAFLSLSSCRPLFYLYIPPPILPKSPLPSLPDRPRRCNEGGTQGLLIIIE